MENVLEVIRQGIMEGDMPLTQEKVQEAIDAKIAPGDILQDGLVAAMAEVGRLFEEGEYFVPEMLIAARAMKAGLALLRPLLVAADVKPAGKVAAGTVKGDLHDIGKNLVCMMLEGAGFEIVDLGVDVSPEKFLDAVVSKGVDVVAMSALLTTTMPNMKVTVDALKEAGVRDKVKVIIGGAPVTDAYAREIGADGYAPDASRAVTLAKSLVAA
ncbi:MAG TPA: corrinoid protein [Anaerolineae bacterium]|nr:corrinoid protein [Anaerolineae bacterium]HQI86773.1 corrinoid protein [Anaerolineae bacterium]